MTIHLLDKLDLISYNKKLNYHLAEAEKDYMITIVLKEIFSSALKDILVFKGGTAIHHCYLKQLRFSEDIDFTSLDKRITLNHIKEIIQKFDIFEVKKEFTSNATLKIEQLKYTGPLKQPNSLKIEIDKKQNVYLRSKLITYSNVWDIDFKVNVMDEREISAEKIRAMSERSRYRDFFDFYWLVNEFDLDKNEILQILTKKEIRKPIEKKNIFKNLDRAIQEFQVKKTEIFYKKKTSKDKIINLIKSLDFSVIEEGDGL